MGILRKFENTMEDSLEGVANRMSNSPIDPVKIAKKAEKQMMRQKMVGAGKQYAPTLYTVLVNVDDDERLSGYYPTLAGETETYLAAKAHEKGLVMDGQPLVRFIADGALKTGRFDVIAETVAAPIVNQLRMEEMQRYGIIGSRAGAGADGFAGADMGAGISAVQASRNRRAANRRAYGDGQDAYGGRYGYESNGSADAEWQSGNASVRGDAGNGSEFAASDRGSADDPYAVRRRSRNGRQPDRADSFAYGHVPGDDRDASGVDRMGYMAAANPASVPGFAASAGVAAGAAMGAAAGAAAAHTPADPYANRSFARPDAQTVMMGASNLQAGGYAAAPQNLPRARLTNLTTGEVHFTRSDRVVIGRGTSCDIILEDLNSSRNHAELRYEPQGFWTIADLGSTNGTFVNGRPATAVQLHEGDTICIGVTNLTFSTRV